MGDLVHRCRTRDRKARAALFQYCLPGLTRRAQRHCPPIIRQHLDPADIVLDVALQFLRRSGVFEAPHAGDVDAYLGRCLDNRIRDESRRFKRRGRPETLAIEPADSRAPPYDILIDTDSRSSYRHALSRLRPNPRSPVVGRFERDWSYAEITSMWQTQRRCRTHGHCEVLRQRTAELRTHQTCLSSIS